MNTDATAPTHFDGAPFRKSDSSGTAGCVEVAVGATRVAVRDTKNRAGGTQVYTHDEWAAFIDGARRGQFDLP